MHGLIKLYSLSIRLTRLKIDQVVKNIITYRYPNLISKVYMKNIIKINGL